MNCALLAVSILPRAPRAAKLSRKSGTGPRGEKVV